MGVNTARSAWNNPRIGKNTDMKMRYRDAFFSFLPRSALAGSTHPLTRGAEILIAFAGATVALRMSLLPLETYAWTAGHAARFIRIAE
jgi:hypothetical protein